MPGVKFKLDRNQSLLSTKNMIYVCQDCKEKVDADDITTHAVTKHKATTVDIDTNFEKIKDKKNG